MKEGEEQSVEKGREMKMSGNKTQEWGTKRAEKSKMEDLSSKQMRKKRHKVRRTDDGVKREDMDETMRGVVS